MTPLELFTEEHTQLAIHLTTQYRHLCTDLIAIRHRKNIDTEALAHAIGIPHQGVLAFEDDPYLTTPTIEFILRYAHAIGATLTIHTELAIP